LFLLPQSAYSGQCGQAVIPHMSRHGIEHPSNGAAIPSVSGLRSESSAG
jgi:hypothetical protein